MPTLIVDNVLQMRVAAEKRSLPEETLHLLTQLLREDMHPAPRLPDLIPIEEVSAPCDLPRSSQPVAMTPSPGDPS